MRWLIVLLYILIAGTAQAQSFLNGAPDAPMTDILDIKPIVPGPPPSDYTLWVVAGVVALFIAVGVLGVILMRNRQEPDMPNPSESRQQAFTRIALKAHDDPRWAYFGLSELLRHELEDRWDIPALEMTSDEIVAMLPDIGMGAKAQLLVHFFKVADQVCFANRRPKSETIDNHLAFAEEFIVDSPNQATGGGSV